MKIKTAIRKMRKYAKDIGASKEVFEFIDNFEESRKFNYKKFTKETYQEYLLSDTWKEIRHRVLRLRGEKCEGCGSKLEIQVHHSQYNKKVIEGKSNRGLRVVCSNCHSKIHKLVSGGISLMTATRLTLDGNKKRPRIK